MANPELRKIVEAVLFAADSPVPLDRLVAIVGEGEKRDVTGALKELSELFDAEERPYELGEVAGGWQVYCRPDYSSWIRELHKGRIPTRLSQAALETLAIIAYKQPIVRAEIETIRGVDSSGVLATLMRRDLITIAGRAPGMGRALMYRTTKEFLRYFGLNYVTDLPRLEEFAEVLGLKPGELELAVEGAESVAEVADDAGEYPDPDAIDAEEAAVLSEFAEDQPARREPSESGQGLPAEFVQAADAGSDDDPPGFDIHGDSHAVSDRKLLEDINEA